VALTAGTSWAERVRTTKSTKVYKRTGEQSGVVTKVAKGKTLDVISKQGRWLKVRVNGRTGWVTQSNVVSLEARDLPRNTRRRPFVDGRSTRRGWSGGAPDDRVGADAVEDDDDGGDDGGGRRADEDDGDDEPRRASRRGDDDDDDEGDDGDGDDEADTVQMVTVSVGKAKLYPRASKRSKPVLTVRRGAKLLVLDESASGDWIRVEDEDGEAGWIAADAVTASDGRSRPKRILAATARLGFASVGGTFDSNAAPTMGLNPPVDYTFGSTAVSIAIGGEAVFAFKQDLYLGAGLEYLGCVATPGIRYASGQMAEDIGFKTHDIDARGLLGYDFHKPNGMTAWARLGYHYGMFSVANLQNLAKIPSEVFKGPTVGAALRIPRLTNKLGAEASLDLVYPGARTQTKGNEDGTESSAMAATLQLGGSYAWKGAWALGAAYRLGYASTSWTGPSARVTGTMGAATAAKRTDIAHVLTVGLGRSF
jgi:SH3-like domain-containing protein